ncbi:unnamed protein product, partial [marine sediment metagenome]
LGYERIFKGFTLRQQDLVSKGINTYNCNMKSAVYHFPFIPFKFLKGLHKTGILFNARLDSTRLKRKHLIKINNLTLIEILILRYYKKFEEPIKIGNVIIVLATSDKEINREFEEIFLNYDFVKIFYGNENNLPQRHIDCAEFYDLTHIISIEGDVPFCSTEGSMLVYEDMINYNKQIVK